MDEIEAFFSKSIEQAKELFASLEDDKKKKPEKMKKLVMILASLDSEFNVYQKLVDDDNELSIKYMDLVREIAENQEIHEQRMEFDPIYKKKCKRLQGIVDDYGDSKNRSYA